MSSVSPNFPFILFMIVCFLIVAAIVTGIVLIVVYSMKSAKPRPQVYQNTNPYQNNHYGNPYTGAGNTHWKNNNPSHFDNNSITHHTATWGAADAFNNQDMNNEMNTNGTHFSDKDHDGIPDQFDTHDNRFDNTMNNDSTSSFDTNTWSSDSSSGGFDSGGSSGGSSDNNNF
jgi:uncharacterized membrane protein YgcG